MGVVLSKNRELRTNMTVMILNSLFFRGLVLCLRKKVNITIRTDFKEPFILELEMDFSNLQMRI